MNIQDLSVLIVASEASPLAQTGGLAEVTGSLPLALRDLGCRVSVAIPAYRRVLEGGRPWTTVARNLPIQVGELGATAEIMAGELARDVTMYLVRRDEFFDRTGLYGGPQGDYFDNPERFIFFSRAIPEMVRALGLNPDVILANDWQTGLVMALLNQGFLPDTAGVFSIHNQGFLGLVPRPRTNIIGLPEHYYTMDGIEYYGQASLLKAGIVYAQAVTTVSYSYSQEIQTPEGGHGLDGVMRAVSPRLHGILNGVDYQVWNPATDRFLDAHYSPDDLAGKQICKRQLLREFGLRHLQDKPVMGMVSRMTPQKGIGLLSEVADELLKMDVGLIILGAGEAWQEEMVLGIQARYPDRVGVKIGYDPPLAHEIIAGCDMLLMPSMYEPCGLAQIYGLKYGTVPVVRAVGGLNDTVRDARDDPSGQTGFKFGPFQARAFGWAAKRAVEVFQDQDRWRAIMVAGMKEDFSWDRSARAYAQVFIEAVKARRGWQ